MKTKKLIKALVAAAMLACVTAAFFGCDTDLACRIQPAATIWFLVVLLLTPIVGRLFCECFCPLGIIQSIVNWIFHPKTKVRRVCTRLPESHAQQTVRWTVLAVSVVLAATGFGAIGWLLTPYSIYGKALTLFAPGVVIFATVVVLAAFGKGRLWCNWICPIGTLFNILSKKSVCAHKIGPGCANCKACFSDGAGNGERIPRAKRVAEGDALAGVGMGNGEDGVTRREALKGVAVLAATEALDKTTDGGYAPVSLPGVPERPAAVLPPGAVDRKAFNVKCVACGLCITNCKGNCLTASTNLKRFGQPEMDFRRGYCLLTVSLAATTPAAMSARLARSTGSRASRERTSTWATRYGRRTCASARPTASSARHVRASVPSGQYTSSRASRWWTRRHASAAAHASMSAPRVRCRRFSSRASSGSGSSGRLTKVGFSRR